MIGEEGEPKVSHLRRLRFHLPHLLTFLAFFPGIMRACNSGTVR